MKEILSEEDEKIQEQDDDLEEYDTIKESSNITQNTESERKAFVSHSVRLVNLYGESLPCFICLQMYDKNAVFLYREIDKETTFGTIFLCFNCSINVDNIHKLRDWETNNSSEFTKRCYRCNCKRSLKRFRKGTKICSYCVLKKKYFYMRRKMEMEHLSDF